MPFPPRQAYRQFNSQQASESSSSPAPTLSGVVRQLKDGSGFWLPNEVIDLHGKKIGAQGLYIYCVLARCTTRSFYPSVQEISYHCRIPRHRVLELLLVLRNCELLNDADFECIGGIGLTTALGDEPPDDGDVV